MTTTEITPPSITPNRRQVDFVEAGKGPLAVLIHSSMAGAHQWSALTRDLQADFRVRAVNLFGYGKTHLWAETQPPSLDDFADLVATAVPATTRAISLVGHSFGGAVAMRLATRQLKGRVSSLVLFEPSLFHLLDCCSQTAAFNEISALARDTGQWIEVGMPEMAAEQFIDYWCGHGTWAACSSAKRSSFARSVTLLQHEWAAVFDGSMTPVELAGALPRHTLVMSSLRTPRPARQIVEILLDTCPEAAFAAILDGGHMAPLTHPQVVNPLIRNFLIPPTSDEQ
jgi:pimeloyl-ACP methyl ester carboxylesterase